MDYIAHQAPLSMGFPKARILKWVALSSTRGSPSPPPASPQGSNECLLHWEVDSLPLSHLGSPVLLWKVLKSFSAPSHCWKNSLHWSCGTEIPISLLTVNWGFSLLIEEYGIPLFTGPLPPSSKSAVPVRVSLMLEISPAPSFIIIHFFQTLLLSSSPFKCPSRASKIISPF